MSIETTITPDVLGLIKPSPVSSRGFMSATAAVAAGSTRLRQVPSAPR